MTRQAIIQKTTKIINLLPPERAMEISDFADYLSKKYEDEIMTEHIQLIVSESDSFYFLNEEEDIYSLEDLKERFHD